MGKTQIFRATRLTVKKDNGNYEYYNIYYKGRNEIINRIDY